MKTFFDDCVFFFSESRLVKNIGEFLNHSFAFIGMKDFLPPEVPPHTEAKKRACFAIGLIAKMHFSRLVFFPDFGMIKTTIKFEW